MTNERIHTVRRAAFAIVFAALLGRTAVAQQIRLARIDMMPDRPSPYSMRDWKRNAIVYDSLVFLSDASGTYLPLLRMVTNTINYPNHSSFAMPTYVGTNSPDQMEAINELPAVISAALAGIDKANQRGTNWALMCEEFFNRRAEENVYLNNPSTESGSDWWYSTMPNVYFYQLASFYPGTGNFDMQFRSVAERWLQALRAMGGSAVPWHVPVMNYRGWHLATMTANRTGVPEPEAAGAIAWLMYQAYVVTKDVRYRIGAEWAMEYLNSLSSNPSYELQLSYGAYCAARMNAELGTAYDLEKIAGWCFDVGPLRNWGAIVGRWGGYDVSGLIGEVNGQNDYAFSMNTFQQIGALVPLVRYDERFADAIGKWVLNAANASRLFYHPSLPASNQDASAWGGTYDPQGAIAYEALRQTMAGVSPFATGDAVAGGWARTNLSLYSSSSAGILGAVIDTTDVPMILTLDLLATDYYHAPAYPTVLVYNPYDGEKFITLDAGPEPKSLYDAAAHGFIRTNVTGPLTVSLPAAHARIIVTVPANGAVRQEGRRVFCNDIVIDHHAAPASANDPPRIKACVADVDSVERKNSLHLYCTAADGNGDTLTYEWSAPHGKLLGEGGLVLWNAPDTIGMYTVTCIVRDGNGGADTATAALRVVESVAPTGVIRREGGGDRMETSIGQNFPNPFNAETTIRFTVAHAGDVTVTIYNILGERMAEFFTSGLERGTYTLPWNAAGAPSGTYFYRLRAGSHSETKRMLLCK